MGDLVWYKGLFQLINYAWGSLIWSPFHAPLSESLTQPHHMKTSTAVQLRVACPCPSPSPGAAALPGSCLAEWVRPHQHVLWAQINFGEARIQMAAVLVWSSWTIKAPQNLNIQWPSNKRNLFLSRILLFFLLPNQTTNFSPKIFVGSASFLSASNHS